MDGRLERDVALACRKSALAHPRCDCLQRVPRGDLGLTAASGRHLRSAAMRRSHRGALGFQHLELRPVDRLEWQQRLKPRLRRRVEPPRSLERPLAIELYPITLKT